MSFNNYARRVRDKRLSFSARAGALRSCIRLCADMNWQKYSYRQLLLTIGETVGADLCNIIEEKPLLTVLLQLERARNKILEARFAFERKRIRQKMRGQRVPDDSDLDALRQKIEQIKHEGWNWYQVEDRWGTKNISVVPR